MDRVNRQAVIDGLFDGMEPGTGRLALVYIAPDQQRVLTVTVDENIEGRDGNYLARQLLEPSAYLLADKLTR